MNPLNFEPKAVFFDIDGTTYQHNIHDVPVSTYEALEQLKRKGVKLAACTSRVRGEMIHLPQRFVNLLDGTITCAGAVMEAHGEIISEHRIHHSDVKRVLEYCKENKVVLRWATSGMDCHIDHWMNEDKLAIFDYLYQMRPTLKPFDDEPVVHLLTFPPMEKEAEIRALLEHSNLIVLTSTLEITDVGISKGSGIREFSAYWGISTDQVIAIGDGKNDIDMFKAAAYSIALGQACDEVKNAADYTTTPLDQDGFYLAFAKLGLIEDTLNLMK